MKEAPYQNLMNVEEEAINIKEIVFKYLAYWHWFLLGILLCIAGAYAYTRYAPVTYETAAKIKIIDDTKEMDIATDAMSLLSGNSKINLENEIEVLKSYRLLSQVVQELQLDVAYLEKGNIRTTQIWEAPFILIKDPAVILTQPVSFEIRVVKNGLQVTDAEDRTLTLGYGEEKKDLPFTAGPNTTVEVNPEDNVYLVTLYPEKSAVLNLSKGLEIAPTNKNAEILSLGLIGQSSARSEAVLNTIIDKFNKDGILDRQLVSQRTLDFIDERFMYLSQELDSIEGNKKSFKQANNLSYIEADAGVTLQKRSTAEAEVYQLENQLELARLLRATLEREEAYSLLPADIGLANNSINNQVGEYNQKVLDREKLLAGAGKNNPTVQVLTTQLFRVRQNLENTVQVYERQLQLSLRQLRAQENRADSQFSRLPEKEQLLRAIERQQSIKENLFLLLLQKREEAAISLAVTAPSIKVVDYALTPNEPLSPNNRMVYGIGGLLGLLLPFGFLYIRFAMDTKVGGREDLEKLGPQVPILAEIPFIEDNKSFHEANDRSVLAESFRILSTNINYILSTQKKTPHGKVVYVTSTIKGEGKTMVALNISLAYASLKKRVLLVGSDLRNPQLHTYFGLDKDEKGLVDYLYDSAIPLGNCVHQGFGKSEYHKVCFSGRIPPNAPELLSGPNFEKFLEQAKKEFDYVIVDTAPTILVTDTLLISQFADMTVFVTRAGYTEKRLLDFSKELHKNNKLQNMAYVLNDVGQGKNNSYNYGYGYGYGANTDTGSWYQRLFK